MFDVVVPFHPKDSDILPWCVRGIAMNVAAARILVVSQRSEKERVESIGATWVDEDSIIDGLRHSSLRHERWGWFFQQLLKYGAFRVVNTKHYLVVDADTIFLRRVAFLDNNKPLYCTSTEFHQPYFDTFQQLLGFAANREWSFTTHHMLYETRLVEEMLQAFRGEGPWWARVLNLSLLKNPPGSLNEQETYGHYIKALHPGSFGIRPLSWSNRRGLPSEARLRRLAKKFDFCSFHGYLRAPRWSPRTRVACMLQVLKEFAG